MTNHRPEQGADIADVDLDGRTILVTGSTGGIGRETALALARLGADVAVHGRDREAGERVVRDLRATGSDADFFAADFADFGAVRDLARAVVDRYSGLDVLVNNAGGYFRNGTTDDGIEYTIAVNHLAPFLLTHHLVPHLGEDDPRVVTVSSEAHRGAQVDVSRFQSGRVGGWTAYAQSKRANVMFSFDLATRLDDVAVNCLHPGVVPGSGFLRHLPGPLDSVGKLLSAVPNPFVESPAEAAETSVYLAAHPEAGDVTGTYFDDCEPASTADQTTDRDAQRLLYRRSADLTDLEDDLILATPDDEAAEGGDPMASTGD